MRSPAVAVSDGDPWALPKIPLEARHELLPFTDYPVSLHERLALLACLNEYGSLPASACLHVLPESPHPVAVLAALILRGVLTADLAAGRLNPETRIRRAEPFPATEPEDGR
jgi:hypothetical protein